MTALILVLILYIIPAITVLYYNVKSYSHPRGFLYNTVCEGKRGNIEHCDLLTILLPLVNIMYVYLYMTQGWKYTNDLNKTDEKVHD